MYNYLKKLKDEVEYYDLCQLHLHLHQNESTIPQFFHNLTIILKNLK